MALCAVAAQAEVSVTAGSSSGERVPIVPCDANADRGCAEVLIEAASREELDGLVNCLTLPTFGEAGVTLTHRLTDVAPVTRRLEMEMQPLSAIAAGSYIFSLGRPDSVTGKLVCSVVLELERASGTLTTPTKLVLPTRHIGPFWREDLIAPAVVKIGPAPGSVAVGPLAVAPTLQLAGSDLTGGITTMTVTLQEGGRVQPGRTVDLTLVLEGTPTLGKQEGEIVLTGPQLTAPVRIAVEMAARIGIGTIFLSLLFGILCGWLVRTRLMPARDLAEAQIVAERMAIWAGEKLAIETDADLLARAAVLIGTMRQAVAGAATRSAIEGAAASLQTGLDLLLSEKAAERQALHERLAPLIAAYALPITPTELPKPALTAHQAALVRAEAMLAARRGDLARVEIAAQLPTLETAAVQDLRKFAARAFETIQALDGWSDPAPKAALAPMLALVSAFAPGGNPALADLLPALRTAWYGLSAAAAGAVMPLEGYLRQLLAGTGGKPDLQAQALKLTNSALAEFETRPLAASETLAELFALYKTHAGGEQFEAAFPSMVEAGMVAARKGTPVPPPKLPDLSLQVQGGFVVRGRPFEVSIGGLLPGEEALVLTPVNCTRLGPEGVPGPARLIAETAGQIAITIRVRQPGAAAYREVTLPLRVDPAPAEARLVKLLADRDRLDLQATLCAMLLALVSGLWIFQAVPLTSWWSLFAPVLWGFFVNLNLTEAIERLQGTRRTLFEALKIP